MLNKQQREYYIKRNAGDDFDKLRGVLESVNDRLEGVVSIDDVRDCSEVLDGGRGNPNANWVGICYSDGREVKFFVNGNVSNRTVSVEMRYPEKIDPADIGKIGRVLSEEGFDRTKGIEYI